MTDNHHPCPWCGTIFPTDRGLGMHLTGPCTQDNPRPPRNKPGHVNARCRVCTLNHTPRCVQVARRWPLGPLARLAAASVMPGQGNEGDIATALGVSNSSIRAAAERGLSDRAADEWAIRCGLHPANVWPDWIDAGLTVQDRRFLETGWRHAWLHLDEPRIEQAA